MTHIMVDVETLGTKRESAPVISIAAVKFNLNKGIVEDKNAFHRNIDLNDALKYGVVEGSTLKWWQTSDKHSVFKDIIFDSHAVTTRKTLDELEEWCGHSITPWAKGTDFDFVLIDRLYEQTGLKNPFSVFWRHRDTRTFVDTIRNLGVPKLVIERRQGLAHNALSDVIYQADELIAYNRAAFELLKEV